MNEDIHCKVVLLPKKLYTQDSIHVHVAGFDFTNFLLKGDTYRFYFCLTQDDFTHKWGPLQR